MYECHVTIGYVRPNIERYEILNGVANAIGFRVAKLYKWNKEQSDLDTFMTAHDDNFDSMKEKMTNLVNALADHGFKVTRYKIEQILLDSKQGDTI